MNSLREKYESIVKKRPELEVTDTEDRRLIYTDMLGLGWAYRGSSGIVSRKTSILDATHAISAKLLEMLPEFSGVGRVPGGWIVVTDPPHGRLVSRAVFKGNGPAYPTPLEALLDWHLSESAQ